MCVARIDRREVAALPTQWTDLEKGLQLRLLLRERGIDPQRLYVLTYHPRHQSWLFTQRPQEPGTVPSATAGTSDDVFYRQLAVELRRTARLACASQGLGWFPYRLPEQPEAVTPADLARELSACGDTDPPVRFTREGGWRAAPSVN